MHTTRNQRIATKRRAILEGSTKQHILVKNFRKERAATAHQAADRGIMLKHSGLALWHDRCRLAAALGIYVTLRPVFLILWASEPEII